MNLPSRDLLLHSRRNSPPYNKAQLFNQSALDCSAWSGRKRLLSAPLIVVLGRRTFTQGVAAALQ